MTTQKRRRKWLVTSVLLNVLILVIIPLKSATAHELSEMQCYLSETTSQVTTLDCTPGYFTPHDRVMIYGNLPEDWPASDRPVTSLPDLHRGTLVFDTGADGTANIVIKFSLTSSGILIADIYDDRDGDGEVALQTGETQHLEVMESGPVVRIEAPDGWWQKNGLTNFNLNLSVDGHVKGHFGYSMYAHRPGLVFLDGNPEVQIHVRDSDFDGRPDLEWRQISIRAPEKSGYYKTEVAVNTEDDEHSIEGAIIWPYVGNHLKYTKGSYINSPPPVGVDWSTSRVVSVGEFVGSRYNAGNYFIYSISRLQEGKVSTANFENPFAFYNLTGEEYVVPTLVIRNAYSPPGDPYRYNYRAENARNDISYTWRHTVEQGEQGPVWEYKVNLVGTHEYEDVVKIGDLKVVTMDYERYPYWVTENTWDFGAFVAAEGTRARNAEALSEWGAILERNANEARPYFEGQSDALSLGANEDISPGYRGEIAPTLESRPEVYISGVDRKLHLYRATNGIWRIDTLRLIRYDDINADGFIDQWRHFEGDELRAQLNLVSNGLIYWAEAEVSFLAAEIPPSVFQSLPPRNHAEWLAMGQALEEFGPSSPESNLQEMFNKSSGPRQTVTNAALRDLRHTDVGYRFILEIKAGAENFGQQFIPGLNALVSGEYVFSYNEQNKEFTIESLTPPRIELEIGKIGHNRIVSGLPVGLPVKVFNRGLKDALALTLVAEAILGGESIEIANETMDVLAGEPTQLLLDWLPARPGEWELIIYLENSSDENGEMPVRKKLVVVPESASEVLALSSASYWRMPAFLIFPTVLVLAALSLKRVFLDP